MVTTFVKRHLSAGVDHRLLDQLKKRLPHFFTDKIEQHRSGAAVPEKPKEPPQLWRNVTRRYPGGHDAFVHLHIDVRLRKFELRDNSGLYIWPVGEHDLEFAVASKGAYVGLRIGADTLRLHRHELLTAFNELRALREAANTR
jgi:hypothetical protein